MNSLQSDKKVWVDVKAIGDISLATLVEKIGHAPYRVSAISQGKDVGSKHATCCQVTDTKGKKHEGWLPTFYFTTTDPKQPKISQASVGFDANTYDYPAPPTHAFGGAVA